jgi:hypothetical protein
MRRARRSSIRTSGAWSLHGSADHGALSGAQVGGEERVWLALRRGDLQPGCRADLQGTGAAGAGLHDLDEHRLGYDNPMVVLLCHKP